MSIALYAYYHISKVRQTVKAHEELAPFWMWAASGSLVDGDWRPQPPKPFVNSREDHGSPIQPVFHSLDIQYIDMTDLASVNVTLGKYAQFSEDLGGDNISCSGTSNGKPVHKVRVPNGATISVSAEAKQFGPPFAHRSVTGWGWYPEGDLQTDPYPSKTHWTYESSVNLYVAPHWVLAPTVGFDGTSYAGVKELIFQTDIFGADCSAASDLMPGVNSDGPAAFFPKASTYRPEPIPTPCCAPEGCYGAAAWPGYYIVSDSIQGGNNFWFGATWESDTVTGYCDELTKLTVEPRLPNGGATPAKCAGEIVVKTAKAGYRPYETVKLTANAFPGYRFVRWEGINGSSLTSGTLDQKSITVKMNSNQVIYAVFELRKALVVTGGVKCSSDTFGALGAAGALGAMKWQVVPVGSPPTAQEILEKIPECSVFAYNGHASPECLGLQYSGCDYNILGQCECDVTKSLCIGAIGATPKSPYKLVYMIACDAGSNWAQWLGAFNGSAFVGFTAGLYNDTAEAFDPKFWGYMSLGWDSLQAAEKAAGEVDQGNYSQKLIPIKAFYGVTSLTGCN